MAALLASPTLFEAELRQAQSTDERRRGRVEKRSITTAFSKAVDLQAYSGFAGVQQVFRLTRRTQFKKSGLLREQEVFGITSLSPVQGSAQELLSVVRGHWRIENRSHYVRDVTFDEDRSQVRTGSLPQVMAALRNLAISLMRFAGHANVAAACRYFAAKPREALRLLGLPRTE